MSDTRDATIFNKILRKELKPFTVNKAQKLLEKEGVRMSAQLVAEYLELSPYVIKLEGRKYVTRAGCFTGRFFNIAPTKYEIEKGILIPGDRCMPFVDPEKLPDELIFVWNGGVVPHRIAELSTSELLQHYNLYGEEYAAQYLAYDPCNSQHDYSANCFELPARMNLTVLDMTEVYRSTDFQPGDRLVLFVNDWDMGILSLGAHVMRKENPFEETVAEDACRQWNSVFEDAFIKSMEKFGPCSSIEEQLAMVYVDNMVQLTDICCGSVEEFLAGSKKVDVVEYGVESRLWRTDSEIPAAGGWAAGISEEIAVSGTMYSVLGLPVPDYVFEAFVYDSLFRKESTCARIMLRILPDISILTSFQQSLLLLHLERQHAIIKRTYNWFADYEIGDIRRKALTLYSRILGLVCELDRCDVPVDRLPQQELVILSQLFGHTGRLIEAFVYQKSISDKDISAAQLSLEGMNFSFDEIQAPIREAVADNQRHSFSIVKKERKNERNKNDQ